MDGERPDRVVEPFHTVADNSGESVEGRFKFKPFRRFKSAAKSASVLKRTQTPTR